MKIITDEHCTGYSLPGHPEGPERIIQSLSRLRSQNELPIEWAKPGLAGDAQILRAHAPELQANIEAHGLNTITPHISELAKGGGYIRCTTLTLDN